MQPIFSSFSPTSVSPDDPKPAQTTFIIIIIISVSISPLPLFSLPQDIPLLFSPLPHCSRHRRRLRPPTPTLRNLFPIRTNNASFFNNIFFTSQKRSSTGSNRRCQACIQIYFFFFTKKMFVRNVCRRYSR